MCANGEAMSIDDIEDYETLYGIKKLPRQSVIEPREIYGVLPRRAVRNPIGTSASSQKTTFVYRVPATGFRDEVGLTDSLGETAVGDEILISPETYDLEFQALEFPYEYPTGNWRTHTIDMRLTTVSGRRVLIFVRYEKSLKDYRTWKEIDAIEAAYPRSEADDFIVVNANDYTRARRDNLRRMHRLVVFQPDPLADDLVFEAVQSLNTLWLMKDICKAINLSKARIFQACNRLIARGLLGANMDAVICHHSRVWKV